MHVTAKIIRDQSVARVKIVPQTNAVKVVFAGTVSGGGGGGAPDVWLRDKFTANGVQQTFTLSVMFKTNSCLVFLNGVLGERGVDYNEGTNMKSIVYLSPPTSGWKIEVIYVAI